MVPSGSCLCGVGPNSATGLTTSLKCNLFLHSCLTHYHVLKCLFRNDLLKFVLPVAFVQVSLFSWSSFPIHFQCSSENTGNVMPPCTWSHPSIWLPLNHHPISILSAQAIHSLLLPLFSESNIPMGAYQAQLPIVIQPID